MGHDLIFDIFWDIGDELSARGGSDVRYTTDRIRHPRGILHTISSKLYPERTIFVCYPVGKGAEEGEKGE
jgi:hypothetical protein